MEVCNICGLELDYFDIKEDFSLVKDIGYGSIHDGEHLNLHMCCSCFDKVMDIISPLCIHNPISEIH